MLIQKGFRFSSAFTALLFAAALVCGKPLAGRASGGENFQSGGTGPAVGIELILEGKYEQSAKTNPPHCLSDNPDWQADPQDLGPSALWDREAIASLDLYLQMPGDEEPAPCTADEPYGMAFRPLAVFSVHDSGVLIVSGLLQTGAYTTWPWQDVRNFGHIAIPNNRYTIEAYDHKGETLQLSPGIENTHAEENRRTTKYLATVKNQEGNPPERVHLEDILTGKATTIQQTLQVRFFLRGVCEPLAQKGDVSLCRRDTWLFQGEGSEHPTFFLGVSNSFVTSAYDDVYREMASDFIRDGGKVAVVVNGSVSPKDWNTDMQGVSHENGELVGLDARQFGEGEWGWPSGKYSIAHSSSLLFSRISRNEELEPEDYRVHVQAATSKALLTTLYAGRALWHKANQSQSWDGPARGLIVGASKSGAAALYLSDMLNGVEELEAGVVSPNAFDIWDMSSEWGFYERALSDLGICGTEKTTPSQWEDKDEVRHFYAQNLTNLGNASLLKAVQAARNDETPMAILSYFEPQQFMRVPHSDRPLIMARSSTHDFHYPMGSNSYMLQTDALKPDESWRIRTTYLPNTGHGPTYRHYLTEYGDSYLGGPTGHNSHEGYDSQDHDENDTPEPASERNAMLAQALKDDASIVVRMESAEADCGQFRCLRVTAEVVHPPHTDNENVPYEPPTGWGLVHGEDLHKLQTYRGFGARLLVARSSDRNFSRGTGIESDVYTEFGAANAAYLLAPRLAELGDGAIQKTRNNQSGLPWERYLYSPDEGYYVEERTDIPKDGFFKRYEMDAIASSIEDGARVVTYEGWMSIEDEALITAYYVLAHEFDGRSVEGREDLNQAMIETNGWYGSSFIRYSPGLGTADWEGFSALVDLDQCDSLGFVTARD